jgi:DNA polymerase III subunit epsilon
VSARVRPGRRELLTVGVALYCALVAIVLGLLVVSGLTGPERDAVVGSVRDQAGVLVVVAVLGGAGFLALVTTMVGWYTTTARRLAAETRVLLYANPDLRVDRSGPPELAELADAIGQLADQRRVAGREVAAQVDAARASLEQERNRLAALMAELAVAVVVCTVDGRILLYNTAARSLADDGDAVVGLGRSVFDLVDPDLIAYALGRFTAGALQAQVATTLRGQQVLRVHLGAVRGTDDVVEGLVLVLEDLTERLRRSDRRDALQRDLTERTRAALDSIQAAIETVVDHPDLAAGERGQLLGIVRDETRGLGRQVERWVAESADYLGADWLRTEISGHDLLAVVERAVQRGGIVEVGSVPTTEPMWVRADSHALAQAATHLAGHLHNGYGVEAVMLMVTCRNGQADLELRWDRRAPTPAQFEEWLDEPLPGSAAGSAREVVARHGGEISYDVDPAGSATLRLLLPLAEATTLPAVRPDPPADTPSGGASRPEFYDFQLFDWAEESTAWLDRPLAAVGYTVFDTETTGLDPAQGDEIVSVSAVRVVNGRLLRTETFERLVDPQRSVPAASTAFHGLTADLLAGQPTIDAVLPAFARYAHDTVLVGHNVGFDLQFFRLKEARTGVRFGQPVLDTLLLDAALHPDHDGHSLEAIAGRLGVALAGRHTATGDALITAEVFVRLLGVLEQRGIATVGDAVEMSRATLQARSGRSLYGESTAP